MLIKNNSDEIQSYLVDAANYSGSAEAVYFPTCEADVISILKNANQTGSKVTVAGNGTGLTGGRVPESGIVIATDKLNRVIEINEKEKFAIVQPGVVLSDFENELTKRKLYYPPDPTEQNCFIGATVATNASGSKTFRYGPTRNFVQSMRVVLPDGEACTFTRGEIIANGYKLNFESDSSKKYSLTIPDYKMPETKHAAGYYCRENMDAIDLFIGSEGTLGVITEIKLKLLDHPENILSCVLFFDDESHALNFISEARNISFETRKNKSVGIDALGLEFYDFHALKFLIEDYPHIPNSAKAAVWFEQEIDSTTDQIVLHLWIDLIVNNNCNTDEAWFAANDTEREKFKDFRHAVSWKVSEFIAKKRIKKVGTDTAVTDENFDEFYRLSKEMVESAKLNYVAYGHFGNSHLHLNMLPENETQYVKAKEIYKQICGLAVRLGGTISAEHGIGKLKREYLLDMFGTENIRKMAAIKKQLDPNSILGIGNIFDESFLKSI